MGIQMLRRRIASIVDWVDGRMGVAILDVTTGEETGISSEDLFPMASVCKTPILVAAYRYVEAGRLALDKRIEITRDTRVAGTGHQLRRDPAVEHDGILGAKCAHHGGHLGCGQPEGHRTERCAESVESRERDEQLSVRESTDRQARVSMTDIHSATGGLQCAGNRAIEQKYWVRLERPANMIGHLLAVEYPSHRSTRIDGDGYGERGAFWWQ